MYSFILLPHIVFHRRCVCLVWTVNIVREISGRIIRRDTCFPLELGEGCAKGRLCLSCLIKVVRVVCTAEHTRVCTEGVGTDNLYLLGKGCTF